ncbi:MAG: hypothetical protein M1823_005227 [Watsoniomyces obsoletus]|nr:MAG: hypothetical protein M1823_005227 [Watsoniomyces obsoletus]
MFDSGHRNSAVLGYMTTGVISELNHLAASEGVKLGRLLQVQYVSNTVMIIGKTVDERSQTVGRLAQLARKHQTFKILERWRDEIYPVYGPTKELLFHVERSFCPLLGVITYGVHMTAYVQTSNGVKIWIPRRNKTKQTYGGMLDNTVAGGISSGETPLETLIREAKEEASLSPGLVRTHAKACGTVTYFHIRDVRAGGETGLYQPECQYVYDLELGPEVTPEPNDDEVENFQLWDVKMVQDAMAKGEFKPNCALVMLDFFIRHGILTPENEPDYIEIVARIHRRLEFPTP